MNCGFEAQLSIIIDVCTDFSTEGCNVPLNHKATEIIVSQLNNTRGSMKKLKQFVSK